MLSVNYDLTVLHYNQSVSKRQTMFTKLMAEYLITISSYVTSKGIRIKTQYCTDKYIVKFLNLPKSQIFFESLLISSIFAHGFTIIVKYYSHRADLEPRLLIMLGGLGNITD